MRYRYNLTNYNNEILDFFDFPHQAYRILLDIVFRIHKKWLLRSIKLHETQKKLCQLRDDMNWHCSDIKREKLFAIVSRNAKL